MSVWPSSPVVMRLEAPSVSVRYDKRWTSHERASTVACETQRSLSSVTRVTPCHACQQDLQSDVIRLYADRHHCITRFARNVRTEVLSVHPACVCDFWEADSQTSVIERRSSPYTVSGCLAVTGTRTTLSRRNFAVTGAIIWNNLPADLRLHSQSLLSFRQKLKQYLFEPWACLGNFVDVALYKWSHYYYYYY